MRRPKKPLIGEEGSGARMRTPEKRLIGEEDSGARMRRLEI